MFRQKDPADHHKTSHEIILTDGQKTFLKNLAEKLRKSDKSGAEYFQEIVFSTLKESGIKPKDAFSAFYLKLTGETHGPKAGELIASMTKEKTIEKIFRL